MNQLYKLTSMETSFAVNMLAIHDNRPKTLAMMDAINFYIEHRREVVVRRTRYLLGDAEKDAERLEAFLLALHHMDDFISIIRDSKTGMKPVNACRITPSPRRRRKAWAS